MPSSSAAWTRSATIRSILAFVCVLSVKMPTWRPVKERASKPIARNAIASRAIVTRSPVESSMSISRSSGNSAISCASLTRRSVSPLMAETTTTTVSPACRLLATRPATCLIRSMFATEVPPNF